MTTFLVCITNSPAETLAATAVALSAISGGAFVLGTAFLHRKR